MFVEIEIEIERLEIERREISNNNIWCRHAWVVHREFVEIEEVTNKGTWEDILVAEKIAWQ